MIRKIKFRKSKTERWYADIPEWEGSKEDLEMVMGADDFINLIAQGDDVVYVQLGDEKFPGGNQMILIDIETSEIGGAWYLVPSIGQIDFNLRIWLCDVTKFIFGNFPETIWFYRSF